MILSDLEGHLDVWNHSKSNTSENILHMSMTYMKRKAHVAY